MFEYTVKKHPRFLKKIIIIYVSLSFINKPEKSNENS